MGKDNEKKALPAASREDGWAHYSRRVAVVKVHGETVAIHTGHICSTPISHIGVENRVRTIVWFDEPWRDADSADDEHEFGIEVASPNLLGADEIGLLRYPDVVTMWFGKKYPGSILSEISHVAARVVFPVPNTEVPVIQGFVALRS